MNFSNRKNKNAGRWSCNAWLRPAADRRISAVEEFPCGKKIELILPELFNPRNPQDVDPQKWIQRAEEVVDGLTTQNAEVILIGFSMGGVIGAHLAAVKPVKS